MSEWKEYRLGDLADKIAMGPFGSNIKVETFQKSGIPIISGMHLHGIRLLDKDFNYISEEHAERLSNSSVFRHDVIFTHAGTIGQVSYIPDTSKFERYVISQRQFYLRCNPEKLDYKYITYFFKSPYGQYLIDSNTNQTGVPSIAQPATFLKNAEILLPPLPEQKAIAGVLSSLDDKIDLLHRQNKTLEAMAEALFRQWFVEPCKDGLPEGWRECSLLNFIELAGGGTPKTDIPEYWDGGIPWLAGGDIASNHKSFIQITEKTISEQGLNNSSSKLLPKYSTVISARGTVGKYCLLSEPMAFSQSNYGVSPRINNCYFFTYLLINHVVEELQSSAYGSVFDTITMNTFRDIKVYMPQEDAIKSFENNVFPYFNKLLLNKKQIRILGKLRDTLLPKLIGGEIKVTM